MSFVSNFGNNKSIDIQKNMLIRYFGNLPTLVKYNYKLLG